MLFKELNIFRKHGVQFVKNIATVELDKQFRGRPTIDDTITESEAELVANLCPTEAIGTSPLTIDLGKCVFCKECSFALPGKIKFTNDYKIASNDRLNLIVKAGIFKNIELRPEKLRHEIKSYFGHALKLRQVSAGGDNSAEMELNACGNVNFDMGRWGIEFVASPRHADGLVITSILSMVFAGICCNTAALFAPIRLDGLPFIRIRTFSDPRRLTFPSISTCSDGICCISSLAVPEVVIMSLPMLKVFRSMELVKVDFSAITSTLLSS